MSVNSAAPSVFVTAPATFKRRLKTHLTVDY